jgi:hypothetical protein
MSAALVCVFAFLSLFQGPARTDPSATPDDRAEVRHRLESFDKLAKDPDKDADAVGMLDGMVALFKESGTRDRGKLMKSMVACVKLFDAKKDKPRNLPIAAAERLNMMGPDSLKPIQELLGDVRVGKEMARVAPLTAGLVKLAMGAPEALDAAIKMLDDSNPRLYAGLVPAFATLELETQAKRKRVCGALIPSFETFSVRVEKDKALAAAGDEKVKFVENTKTATIATLNALAVQKQPDVAAFKAWYAENKSKDWPEK